MNDLRQEIRSYVDHIDRIAEDAQTSLRPHGTKVLMVKRSLVGLAVAAVAAFGIVAFAPRVLLGSGARDTATIEVPPAVRVPSGTYIAPRGPACQASQLSVATIPQVEVEGHSAVHGQAPPYYPGMEAFEIVNRSSQRCLLPWTPKLLVRTVSGSTINVRVIHLGAVKVQAVEPGKRATGIIEDDPVTRRCSASLSVGADSVTVELPTGDVRFTPASTWKLRPTCGLWDSGVGGSEERPVESAG